MTWRLSALPPWIRRDRMSVVDRSSNENNSLLCFSLCQGQPMPNAWFGCTKRRKTELLGENMFRTSIKTWMQAVWVLVFLDDRHCQSTTPSLQRAWLQSKPKQASFDLNELKKRITSVHQVLRYFYPWKAQSPWGDRDCRPAFSDWRVGILSRLGAWKEVSMMTVQPMASGLTNGW